LYVEGVCWVHCVNHTDRYYLSADHKYYPNQYEEDPHNHIEEAKLEDGNVYQYHALPVCTCLVVNNHYQEVSEQVEPWVVNDLEVLPVEG
jgi:hypothetical protein